MIPTVFRQSDHASAHTAQARQDLLAGLITAWGATGALAEGKVRNPVALGAGDYTALQSSPAGAITLFAQSNPQLYSQLTHAKAQRSAINLIATNERQSGTIGQFGCKKQRDTNKFVAQRSHPTPHRCFYAFDRKSDVFDVNEIRGDQRC